MQPDMSSLFHEMNVPVVPGCGVLSVFLSVVCGWSCVNVARFVNQNCNSNCCADYVFFGHLFKQISRETFVGKRNNAVGEGNTIDYGERRMRATKMVC